MGHVNELGLRSRDLSFWFFGVGRESKFLAHSPHLNFRTRVGQNPLLDFLFFALQRHNFWGGTYFLLAYFAYVINATWLVNFFHFFSQCEDLNIVWMAACWCAKDAYIEPYLNMKVLWASAVKTVNEFGYIIFIFAGILCQSLEENKDSVTVMEKLPHWPTSFP